MEEEEEEETVSMNNHFLKPNCEFSNRLCNTISNNFEMERAQFPCTVHIQLSCITEETKEHAFTIGTN